MTPRDLPDVTLVTVDSVARDLTIVATRRTLEQINPAETLTLTGPYDNIATVEVAMWYSIPKLIDTSHALFIQYDGWVLNGALWNDRWLKYDYIGALWPWHPPRQQVGNGGFSLRSKRLMNFLATNRAEFPCITPEDDTLCRHYRPALEAHGFKWAPLDIASQFSFEREPARPTFGFHGIFNVPFVLPPAAVKSWKDLANDYVRSKIEWKEI